MYNWIQCKCYEKTLWKLLWIRAYTKTPYCNIKVIYLFKSAKTTLSAGEGVGMNRTGSRLSVQTSLQCKDKAGLHSGNATFPRTLNMKHLEVSGPGSCLKPCGSVPEHSSPLQLPIKRHANPASRWPLPFLLESWGLMGSKRGGANVQLEEVWTELWSTQKPQSILITAARGSQAMRWFPKKFAHTRSKLCPYITLPKI